MPKEISRPSRSQIKDNNYHLNEFMRRQPWGRVTGVSRNVRGRVHGHNTDTSFNITAYNACMENKFNALHEACYDTTRTHRGKFTAVEGSDNEDIQENYCNTAARKKDQSFQVGKGFIGITQVERSEGNSPTYFTHVEITKALLSPKTDAYKKCTEKPLLLNRPCNDSKNENDLNTIRTAYCNQQNEVMPIPPNERGDEIIQRSKTSGTVIGSAIGGLFLITLLGIAIKKCSDNNKHNDNAQAAAGRSASHPMIDPETQV